MIVPSRISIGWLLCAAVAVTALIALNRGVDLLWGIALLLAMSIIVAFVLPKLQLRSLHVERYRFPTSGTVGQPLTLSYRVRAGGWLGRYGIELYDTLPAAEMGGPTAYLAKVSGDQTLQFAWIPEVRGCWPLSELIVESRYPLGLSKARNSCMPSSEGGASSELIIYPDYVPLRSLPVIGDATPHAEHRSTRLRGGHDEFFSVRPHHPEDPPRAIHWRVSARTGELVVKEYEHQLNRQIWIILELSEDEHVGSGAASTFEYMIRIAHSVIVKAREDEIPVGLLYDDGAKVQRAGPGIDHGTYLQLREALARVIPRSQPALTSQLDRLWDVLPSGGTWLLFTPRDPSGRAALLRGARQRSAYPLYVEFDHDSFVRGQREPHVRTQSTAEGLVSIVADGADLSTLFRI